MIPTSLYASKMWATYRRHIKFLEKCQLPFLRRSYLDHQTEDRVSVLEHGLKPSS